MKRCNFKYALFECVKGVKLLSKMQQNKIKKRAFTLPEILISLTVIGIVAAIVIPSLIADFNEKCFIAQRKALYARFSQALPMLDKLNGFGVLTPEVDNVTETFITEALSKVIKITNVCIIPEQVVHLEDMADRLSDCGFPSKITPLDDSEPYDLVPAIDFGGYRVGGMNFAVTTAGRNNGWPEENYFEVRAPKSAAIETANGESIIVQYHPSCEEDYGEREPYWVQSKICANFIYDLNGKKGPNKIGKDIGVMTAIYAKEPIIVAPLPILTNAIMVEQNEAQRSCAERDSNSRVPNKEEMMSIALNRGYFSLDSIPEGSFWTSSKVLYGDKTANFLMGILGNGRYETKVEKHYVVCIKK